MTSDGDHLRGEGRARTQTPRHPKHSEGVRHHRLGAIITEHRCSMPDRRTQLAFLAPDERTPRFAAVTSTGRPRPGLHAVGCRLLVADSIWVLGSLLDHERDAGRLAHGRVWDLDGTWDALGNFDPRYSSRVVAETDVFPAPVRVPERTKTCLFDHPRDAEDFAPPVRHRGEPAVLSREDPLHHGRGAEAPIGADAAAARGEALFDTAATDRPTLPIYRAVRPG